MELDKILAISKKPGLYKLITQSRGGFIAESLLDQKRISVSISTDCIQAWGPVSPYNQRGQQRNKNKKK